MKNNSKKATTSIWEHQYLTSNTYSNRFETTNNNQRKQRTTKMFHISIIITRRRLVVYPVYSGGA